MNCNPSWAAFYAAIVSAVASIAALIGTTIAAHRADLRAARREVIAPTLPELLEGIYSIVARTKQAIDASDPQTAAKKWSRADEAASQVEKLRLKSRLYLGDISDAVHQMILAPRIARHCSTNPERCGHVVPLATRLRETIEHSLRTAYVEGRFPNSAETEKVLGAAKEFSNFFSESKDWNVSDDAG